MEGVRWFVRIGTAAEASHMVLRMIAVGESELMADAHVGALGSDGGGELRIG